MDLLLLNPIVLRIHHPEGCVSATSDTSGIHIVSSVHGVRQSLPIQGSLLWSLRGSAGLHADSGILPRAGSSFSEDGPPVVQLFRDSRQLGEVSAYVASEDVLPWSPIGLCQLPGLSSPETIQQASLNWLPVSIMRGSICEFLARVDGDSILSDSAHSGGTAADAVVPVCPSQLHPSSRSLNSFLCAPVFSFVGSELRSGGVCGQYDSAGLPAESGGHQLRSF